MSSSLDSWVSNPAESHGPLMEATTWSLLGVAAVFLLLRLCIRQSQGKVWFDDFVLVLSLVSMSCLYSDCRSLTCSQVLLLVQVIINQLTVNLGFGKHALDSKLCNRAIHCVL
jgi:hypothetical protein